MQNTRQNSINKSKSKPYHASRDKHSHSISSKLESSMILNAIQNPTEIISKVFSFNSVVGKGILLCLQNQYNLSQLLFEAIQTFDEEKPLEQTSSFSKLCNRKGSRIDEFSSNDTFSLNLAASNKDKRIAMLGSKVENFMSELSGLLTLSELKQNEPSISINERDENSPYKVTKKWKQEQKRTSVPLLTQNLKTQDSYFPIARKMRKNSNLIDDRRTITDTSLSSLSRISKAPFTPIENLTFDLKDNAKDLLKKKEISLTDSRTPKVTLKLGTPQTFTKSRKNSRVDPSPKESKENPKYFSQILKDIHPPNEGFASAVKNTTPKQQKPSERGPSLSDIFGPQPIRKPSPTQEIYEETLPDQYGEKNFTSQNTSVIQMTLVDDTERVVKPSDLEEEGGPIDMISGTGNVGVMEKRIVKGILEEESREMALAISKGGQKMQQEKKNLINARWMRAWKEYVNFDSGNDNIGGLNLGGYTRPGKIINRGLLKYDVINDLGAISADLELKENLLEHHDYEVVSKRLFSVLAKWYGCDFEIVRAMKADPFKKDKLYLDLYPEGDMKGLPMKQKDLSPNYNPKTENIITNIINSNLSDFQVKQGKMKAEVKYGLR